jgi:hypothetical protein
MTPTIKLMDPRPTLTSHSCQLSGTVLAKVPRNSMITTWKAAVTAMIPMKIQLLNMPRKTLIFCISLLFISLNT